MSQFTRRRLLQVGTAGTATAIAGCSSITDSSDEDGTPDGEFTATAAVEIDDEENMQIQQEAGEKQEEIQQEVEAGEIDQEEAQERMQEVQQEAQEAQRELLTEATDAATSRIEDTDGVGVADSAAESGILLVTGDAAPILELLNSEEVGALVSEAQFEELTQGGF